MLRQNKRIEVTLEKREVLVVHRRKNFVNKQCPACAKPVWMATPEYAADVYGVKTRTVYQWVEAGLIHFTETPDGTLLVCLNSPPVLTGST